MTPVASGSSSRDPPRHRRDLVLPRSPANGPRWAIAGHWERMANLATGPGSRCRWDCSTPRSASPGMPSPPCVRRSSRSSCHEVGRPNHRQTGARRGRPSPKRVARLVSVWRAVPVDVAARGASAAASRPAFAQAVIARPSRNDDDPRAISDAAFERRLVVARRRLETAARRPVVRLPACPCPPPRRERSCTRASSSAAACSTCTRTWAAVDGRVHGLPSAVRHEHPPVWRLAQPFRFIAHNGEINTVAAIASRSAMGRRRPGLRDRGRLLAAGPPLSEDGSDPLSLDEALELLTTTGWELTPRSSRRSRRHLRCAAPASARGTWRRRTAGFLAPWDGPAAIVFADGRHVGVLVDRNGFRPAAFAVTRDRLVAVASEAGLPPARRRPCGADVSARATAAGRARPAPILETPRRRRVPCGRTDPRRGPSRARRPDRSVGRTGRCAEARLDRRARLRYVAGLDAERARLDIKTMASRATSRCGAWATTRRRPAWPPDHRSPSTCARLSRRSPTRRSTRSASAS